MGEDRNSIRYGNNPKDFESDDCHVEEMEGIKVTLAKRKCDGRMGILYAQFKKPAYTKDQAHAWLAAQKYAIEPADLHEVRGVEIFSVGTWNGRDIKEEDLTQIVEAFKATNATVRPFLKLGHDDEQKILQADGLPAAGWVENVRKVGTKLVADFVDIPKKIFQLIRNKAYRKVSCEIYNNIDINGQKHPKMLGAVALLGADLPGVLNLTDILSLYSRGHAFAGVQKFAVGSRADVILLEETHQTNSEDDMAKEGDSDEYKTKFDQADKDLKSLQALAAEKDKELEAYKKRVEEQEAKLVAAAAQEKKARVDAFVTMLQAEKLCSKAMAPLVKALLIEDKEKYSIEDKELSKNDLVKQLLAQAKDGAKVNFSETTKDEHAVDATAVAARVEQYAKEHKVSYSAAYRAVTRGMKLDAKPLVTQEETN